MFFSRKKALAFHVNCLLNFLPSMLIIKLIILITCRKKPSLELVLWQPPADVVKDALDKRTEKEQDGKQKSQDFDNEYVLSALANHWLFLTHLGPVVQSVVSLTSSLRVISLTVLADSIHNILIFLLKKCE